MANIRRSAKSANEWTASELAAYNISVVPQTKEQFFGVDPLPLPTHPTIVAFMETENRANAPDNETKRLLHYLDLALEPPCGMRNEEAAINDLMENLLEKLGYEDYTRIILPRHPLPFLNCGVSSSAQTDVCVLNDDDEVLLLIQVKCCLDPISKDPEPQVIAEAIAAYAENNSIREASLGLSPLNSMTFPAITLEGTSATFYKITVTEELSTAVQQGRYPANQTQVLKYAPVLPTPGLGMRALPNRVELLVCLEAFKQFIGD